MARRLSIPRRVFLGFALVLTVSGILSLASIVQHQRTAATLHLLQDGYLPLAVMVSQGRATQSVLGNLLDRMDGERHTSATRAFINAGRKGRPRMLRKALASVDKLEALAPPAAERKALARVRRELKRVQSTLRQTERLYGRLYVQLDGERHDAARRTLVDLRVREKSVDGRLRSAWNVLLSRVDATSAMAAEQQQQFTNILVVLGIAALAIGVLVTLWAQRMLSPLPRLQARVEAVARGDFATQIKVPVGDDEIGRLAQEFEAMVAALSARDSRLREVSESQRQLQEMQSQILAGLSAAVLVVDGDGLLLSQNPAAVSVFGMAEDMLGTPWHQTVLAELLPMLSETIKCVSEGGDAKTLHEEAVQGTSERLVNVLVTPFGPKESDGERSGDARRKVLIVAEDVSEAVRTKARLIQTERLAAIGVMAAHVTHEVRNPLSSIGLNVELLEDELGQAGPEAASLLSAIQREIERLGDLTAEYLRVARLPAPSLEAGSVAEVVRDTCSFVAPELSATGALMEVDIQENLPTIALDAAQIRQVLINLIKNGRDAMQRGGCLTVVAKSVQGGVQVSVTDEGRGMEESERARVFDLFYTTKKLGTGLGLPLTQQIVLAHGGKIRCRSRPGQGTAFELFFPALVPGSAGSLGVSEATD